MRTGAMLPKMVKASVRLKSCLQSAVVFLKRWYFLSILQKVFRLYANQTIHCRVHGSPSRTPIRMQYSPIHIPKIYFFGNHFNITLIIGPPNRLFQSHLPIYILNAIPILVTHIRFASLIIQH